MFRRITGLLGAAVLVALGGFLTYFGLGGGEAEATSRSWATVGPLLAGLGVALVIVTFQSGH